MSISLPNGTLLAAPSSTTQQYTAAVTRILHLANFSPELKTRDLQGIFKEYENEKGGFRIKWLDDVNALVVFNDAGIAKRAYLSLLLHPPPHFGGLIKPYDRPDAAQIIQSLAARSMGHRGSTSTAHLLAGGGGAGSISMPPPSSSSTDLPGPGVHGRTLSMSTSSAFGGFVMPKSRASMSGTSGGIAAGRASASGISNGHGHGHGRTGSTSGSTAFSRQPLTGVLNFNLPSGSSTSHGHIQRLPTHSESSDAVSRSASSSDTEPIVVMDQAPFGAGAGAWKPTLGFGAKGEVNGNGFGHGHGYGQGAGRRDSMSAEKAMKEVEKALASVEAQG